MPACDCLGALAEERDLDGGLPVEPGRQATRLERQPLRR